MDTTQLLHSFTDRAIAAARARGFADDDVLPVVKTVTAGGTFGGGDWREYEERVPNAVSVSPSVASRFKLRPYGPQACVLATDLLRAMGEQL
jgi:hypothetical protein